MRAVFAKNSQKRAQKKTRFQLTWSLPPHSPPGRFAPKASCLPTTAPLGHARTDLHLKRTMLPGIFPDYVDRFACVWPRLATTDLEKGLYVYYIEFLPKRNGESPPPAVTVKAAHSTSAPAARNCSRHPSIVAPVVTTSSTNNTRRPDRTSAAPGRRANAPATLAALSCAGSLACACVLRMRASAGYKCDFFH